MTSNVPTSIISQFLHPPVGLLTRELIPGGPFSGVQFFDRPRDSPIFAVRTDAYGLWWSAVAWPDGYGVTYRYHQYFDRDILQLNVQHQLIDGLVVDTSILDTNRITGHLLFTESFPYGVGIWIAPGVQMIFAWLLVPILP